MDAVPGKILKAKRKASYKLSKKSITNDSIISLITETEASVCNGNKIFQTIFDTGKNV